MEAEVTLNEKYQFSTCEIKFLEHLIPKKESELIIKAIKELTRPKNMSELRRLIGMTNHVGKLTENLAKTAKRLCNLLKK